MEVCKGVYIKYVGKWAGGFYNFFKKYFVAQEAIKRNILWPSNFSKDISWPLPLISVSHSSLECRSISG